MSDTKKKKRKDDIDKLERLKKLDYKKKKNEVNKFDPIKVKNKFFIQDEDNDIFNEG